jgi:hypothetical protein
MSGYQSIAKMAGIPLVSDSDPGEIAKLVLPWLEKQSSWLLVFDNLDDATVADGFFPWNGMGKHTLITTRNPNTYDIPAEPIEVPLLDIEDSVDLLLTRSRIQLPLSKSTEREAAYDIMRELGYLPLAIDQAASYVREVSRIQESKSREATQIACVSQPGRRSC